MDTKRRPQAKHPFTESRGKLQIAGGILFVIAFPCLGSYIALGLLGEALRAGWDLLSIAFSGVVLGGMSLGVFVPLWLVTLAFGIGMILEGRKAVRYGRRLTTEGVGTTGVVVDRWTQWIRTKHQCIAYRFEVPAGDGTQRTVVHAESNPAAYQNYRVGMAVPVRYLPEIPTICRLDSESER
jgi:hypothetical protein